MAYQQPYYYPQYPQQQNMQMQIQNSGFVSVRSEMEARNYPVAYGNSVTFKDENAPYVYTKTMGFSQLETPRFEKYKLVKEEPQNDQNCTLSNSVDDLHSYAEKSDLEAIWSEIEAIKKTLVKSKKGEEDERDVKRTVAVKKQPDADAFTEV